jgi:glucosylceramidase
MNLAEGGLRLFGSTWTVPKWIKTNGEYVGGYVRKSMYQTWANYFVKFLEEYDKKGIPFWGVTTQNEPSVLMLSKQINSAGWTSMEMVSRRGRHQFCQNLVNLQSIWIRENLGPALRNSKYSDIKLMILDDQKLWLTWYINAVSTDVRTN